MSEEDHCLMPEDGCFWAVHSECSCVCCPKRSPDPRDARIAELETVARDAGEKLQAAVDRELELHKRVADVTKERDEAYEAMRTHLVVPNDGVARTYTSVPASAWDVVCKDRDEWKRRAQEAGEKLQAAFDRELKMIDENGAVIGRMIADLSAATKFQFGEYFAEQMGDGAWDVVRYEPMGAGRRPVDVANSLSRNEAIAKARALAGGGT